MSKTIWLGAVAYDPKVVTIWEGMRRYFQEEANLPVVVGSRGCSQLTIRGSRCSISYRSLYFSFWAACLPF